MSETFQDQPNRRWFKSAEFWTALATMFLALLAIVSAIIAKQTLELSERAWVSPTGAGILVPPEKTKGIHFTVNILNSGREPATDLHWRFLASTISGYDPEYTDMSNIKVDKNTACDNLMPETERAVAPPNVVAGWSMDTLRAEPAFVADDGILNGTKFLVINGCLAYRTFEKVHRSSFCYVLESSKPQPNKQNVTIVVNPSGAGGVPGQPPISIPVPPSPPQPADARAYNFASCATGWHID
jgi:hypothetical protein